MTPADATPVPPPAPTPEARISIRLGENAFHVEGPEEVVERALARYLPVLDRLAGADGHPLQPAPNGAPLGLVRTADVDAGRGSAAPPGLLTWYQERVVHPDGRRGIVQDHVLLVIYHTTHVLQAPSATTNDIRNGFDTLSMKQPNVPVLVYNLKSKGLIEPADAYAAYVLTATGRHYIEERFSIVRHA